MTDTPALPNEAGKMSEKESVARAYSVHYLGDDTRWQTFLDDAEIALAAVKYALTAPDVAHALPKEAVEAAARAICKSRTGHGVGCCQWPCNAGQTTCYHDRYMEGAKAALAALPHLSPAPPLPGEEIERITERLREELASRSSDGWTGDAWAISVVDAIDCVMPVIAALLSRQPAQDDFADMLLTWFGKRGHDLRDGLTATEAKNMLDEHEDELKAYRQPAQAVALDPTKLSDGDLILCLEEMRSRDALAAAASPLPPPAGEAPGPLAADVQASASASRRGEPAPALKLDIDREWCIAAAEREGDSEVGAGPLAAAPQPATEVERWTEEIDTIANKMIRYDPAGYNIYDEGHRLRQLAVLLRAALTRPVPDSVTAAYNEGIEAAAKIAEEEASRQKALAQRYVRSESLFAQHEEARQSCFEVGHAIRALRRDGEGGQS